MTTWFTSDNHFGHSNIIEYCNRPFSSVEEMDRVMIERWNSKIKKNDVVYYLGDFTLGNYYVALNYFTKLNGHIIFISGSHDRWMQHEDAVNSLDRTYKGGLVSGKIEGIHFTLCHYAMRVWDRSHYGSIHLFGHSHGQTPIIQIPNSMDIGVDTNNFYPYSLEDVLEKLEYDTRKHR